MPTYKQEEERLTQLGQRMTHGPSRVDRVTLADADDEIWATIHGHQIDPETGLVENWRTTLAGPAAISGSIVEVVEGFIRSNDAPTTPACEPAAMAGHLSNFKIAKTGSVWTGCFSIDTDLGPIRVVASADDDMIRQIVRHRTAREMPVEAAAGGFNFFKAIGSVAKSIARARILKRIAKAFNDVAKNPIISQLSGLAKFVPILGPAIQATEQGGHAVKSVMRAAAAAKKKRSGTAAMRQRLVPQRTTQRQPPAAAGAAMTARQRLAIQMARRLFND